MSKPALLVLEDGSVFRGISLGAEGVSCGEVVFNTAMTGYQEILTDPSYCQQMVTLTYPHIGNTGINREDMESDRLWAAALIVRSASPVVSSFRAHQSLQDYLVQQGVLAVSDIDTRKLTRILREKGALNGCLMAGERLHRHGVEEEALALARAFPGLKGMDLARVVSIQEPQTWTEGTWCLGQGYRPGAPVQFRVVAYDFGIKRMIMRLLADRGCELLIVPAQTPADDVLALRPDGILLSNGPGDPEPCVYAIAAIKTFLEKKIPLLGICLGHQLLALACGAKTVKMKFGHHGANHPVEDLRTGRVLITSQNHGFAVDETSLPDCLQATHRSLFDGSLQGIRRKDCPAIGFQGHPEASPGPRDVAGVFDEFIELMRAHA